MRPRGKTRGQRGEKMKKLINEPQNVVNEMLDGMAASHPEYLRRLEGFDVLVRTANRKTDKVALVSGGGSGHEPAHGGYVGYGMLDAAVSGAMFTSPTPDQVYEAIRAADCGAGTLLVIKNYTGDVMNFEMAREMAEMEDLRVEEVIVADDVSVENSTYTTGRRGIAGTVFVHKIAGACAEAGGSLSEVKRIAEKVCANVRSMGMAIEPCTVPEAGRPGFSLAENEMEIGIGIHGEPGIAREPMRPVDAIVEEIFGKLWAEGLLRAGSRAAILVNGMGGTPLSELYVASRKFHELLAEKEVSVSQTMVGNFMTSIEMKGLSLTFLLLDDELEALLKAPADTPALRVR